MAGSRSSWRLGLTIALAAVACAGVLVSCQMPELTRVSEPTGQFPAPASCANCHVEIAREWASSPHATAFVSGAYRSSTNDYRFAECMGCHAPQPMLTASQPTPRATERELGVVCVTCHLDHGAMVGPNHPTGIARPHPIRVEPALFESGTLCGRCHQGTLAQWQAAKVDPKPDCRVCHMPEVHRTMTQATSLISKPLVAAESPGIEHRHTFNRVPTTLPTAGYELRAEELAGDLQVTLVNLLPHNLPTGDFGVRIVRVTAYGTDSAGEESALATWEVDGVTQSIAPGGSRSWKTPLPKDVAHVRIEAVRCGRAPGDQVVLVSKEVDLH